MSKLISVFAVIVILILGFSALNPASAETGQNYSAKELKRMIDSGKPVFLLNPLSEIEFNQAHIPGSVNIPVSQIIKTNKLPKDKETLIVTYCKGPRWVLYKRAASLVANRLYQNVATFKGGLPEWKKAGYPLTTSKALPNYDIMEIEGNQFKEMLGQACILDIRTPKLYSQWNWKKNLGHEKIDSLSIDYLRKYFLKIPLDKLSDQYRKIPKDRMVVVIDWRGKQSLVAARFLKHNGYEIVCRLKGGLTAIKE